MNNGLVPSFGLGIPAEPLFRSSKLYQMIKGEINEQWPCTILQTHPDVTLIVDEEAYAKVASEA